MRQGLGLGVVALLVVLVALDATARAEDPDTLFSEARAAEDTQHDPARALALYEQILREYPDASVAIASERRAAQLRTTVGAHGEYRDQAAAWSALVATADQLPAATVVARADTLAAATWPGAGDAAVWIAGWLCRHGEHAAAQARYAKLSSPAATRAAAACAIEARDWDLADALADRLPAAEPADRATRDELHTQAARGRTRGRLHVAAWLALVLAAAALVASLGEAALRGGRRRPALRPPVEVLFLGPVAAVLVLASYTAHRSIGPAVLRISVTGVVLAWLSGAALDLLRARGRRVRARSVLHIVACALGVVAIGYLALSHDGLLDLLAETMRFGPDA